MASSFVLTNARIAGASAPVDIVVKDGRIAAIGSHASSEPSRIDAEVRFVSPGLVESHLHLDKSRIVARGNGSTRPVASNKTAEGRARNRRTDILFISSAQALGH